MASWDMISHDFQEYLEKSSLYDRIVSESKDILEIIIIQYKTGNYNIFYKIYCKSTSHLQEVLYDKIQKVDHIESAEHLFHRKKV